MQDYQPPGGKLEQEIEAVFGSLDIMVHKFNAAAGGIQVYFVMSTAHQPSNPHACAWAWVHAGARPSVPPAVAARPPACPLLRAHGPLQVLQPLMKPKLKSSIGGP
jgi:hypothetical protein